MARIVTLGEIMLRLKSPALERFFQSPSLEATFGGGEANVAVSLANYDLVPHHRHHPGHLPVRCGSLSGCRQGC